MSGRADVRWTLVLTILLAGMWAGCSAPSELPPPATFGSAETLAVPLGEGDVASLWWNLTLLVADELESARPALNLPFSIEPPTDGGPGATLRFAVRVNDVVGYESSHTNIAGLDLSGEMRDRGEPAAIGLYRQGENAISLELRIVASEGQPEREGVVDVRAGPARIEWQRA